MKLMDEEKEAEKNKQNVQSERERGEEKEIAGHIFFSNVCFLLLFIHFYLHFDIFYHIHTRTHATCSITTVSIDSFVFSILCRAENKIFEQYNDKQKHTHSSHAWHILERNTSRNMNESNVTK